MPSGLPSGLLPLDLMSAQNDTWAASWMSYRERECTNSNQLSQRHLEARFHQIGHAVGFGAGPWALNALFRVSQLLGRPISTQNVQAIHNLVASHAKFDWDYPIMVSLNTEHLSEDALSNLRLVHLHSGSNLPRPLVPTTLTAEYSKNLLKLWNEWDPEQKRYLDTQELAEAKQAVDIVQKTLPEITVLQGAHRLAAVVHFTTEVEMHRVLMVSHGREGNLDGFRQESAKIQELVDMSTFLLVVYPDTMPLACKQVLSENMHALPAQPPSFGEHVAQLRLKWRAHRDHNPNTLANDSCAQFVNWIQGMRISDNGHPFISPKLQKMLNHPFLVKALIYNPVSIPVMDQCVSPIVDKLVTNGAGLAVAYLFLSLDLLAILSSVVLPSSPEVDRFIQESTPQNWTPEKAQHAFNIITHCESVQVADYLPRASAYNQEMMVAYTQLYYEGLGAKLAMPQFAGKPINWRHADIVHSSRVLCSRFALCIRSQLGAAGKEFADVIHIYSMLPIVDENDVLNLHFIPEAQLPSLGILRHRIEGAKWLTDNPMANILLGYSLDEQKLLWSKIPRSMDTSLLKHCACEPISSFVHRHFYRDAGVVASFALSKAIMNLESPALANAYAAVASWAYTHTGLTSFDDIDIAVKQLHADYGLSRHQRNAELVHRQLNLLFPTATGYGDLETILNREQAALKDLIASQPVEHTSLDQEVLSTKLVALAPVIGHFLRGIDFRAWSASEAVSSRRFLAQWAINYGLYTTMWRQHFIHPHLEESEAGRYIFQYPTRIPEFEPWWMNDPNTTSILESEIELVPSSPTLDAEHNEDTGSTGNKTPTHEVEDPNTLPDDETLHGDQPRNSNQEVIQLSTMRLVPMAPPAQSATNAPQTKPGSMDIDDGNSDLVDTPSSRSTELEPIPSTSKDQTRLSSPTPVPPHTDPDEDKGLDRDQPETEDDDMLEDDDDDYVGVPYWASKPSVSRKGVTTTKEVLEAIRPPYVTTNNTLSDRLFHNHVAQHLALRNVPGRAGEWDVKDHVKLLKFLGRKSQKIIPDLANHRQWFLQALNRRIQADIACGPEMVHHCLGMTVSSTRDVYITKLADIFSEHCSEVSYDACLNEALRIAHGDGLFEDNLVDWDENTQEITINIKPTLPVSAQETYDGITHAVIGKVPYPQEDSPFVHISNQMTPLYGPGPTQHACSHSSNANLRNTIRTNKIMRTRDGHVALAPSASSHAMKGDAPSAFSTGRYIPTNGIPAAPGMDSEYQHLHDAVNKYGHRLQYEHQRMDRALKDYCDVKARYLVEKYGHSSENSMVPTEESEAEDEDMPEPEDI